MSQSGYEGDALEKHLLWKVSESRMWRQCINNRVSINVPFNSGSSRAEKDGIEETKLFVRIVRA